MPDVEGKIGMAARRQVTNKLQGQYRKASKADKGRVLDEVVATTGMGGAADADRPETAGSGRSG